MWLDWYKGINTSDVCTGNEAVHAATPESHGASPKGKQCLGYSEAQLGSTSVSRSQMCQYSWFLCP